LSLWNGAPEKILLSPMFFLIFSALLSQSINWILTLMFFVSFYAGCIYVTLESLAREGGVPPPVLPASTPLQQLEICDSENLPQRTCISRPLPTLITNSLMFRLVRIYHKGRLFQDHYLHWQATVGKPTFFGICFRSHCVSRGGGHIRRVSRWVVSCGGGCVQV
jgi:hypothetical protein